MLDQFWSLNPKESQSTLETACMVEGRGERGHVVNEIQEHADGVPPSCVPRPGCNSTSFQSESHLVPRGPTDPAWSIIKRQGRKIINNREQTDNTAALRQRLNRSGQRSAISPLPHNRDQGLQMSQGVYVHVLNERIEEEIEEEAGRGPSSPETNSMAGWIRVCKEGPPLSHRAEKR